MLVTGYWGVGWGNIPYILRLALRRISLSSNESSKDITVKNNVLGSKEMELTQHGKSVFLKY